ncbi:hypothetical protein OHT59_46665 [Streptomyces sp. NBC_00243]|uniref:hypothetical protein n=1 Tax=Streptomyces sp. NBC_00243 TaxID=2975688 RepID=UPI002DD8859B|nr:hypothetical protein [Streptomyces sp. NBC_00243]WRZ25479.1 hypothetical protein OHT59_46665 [Streptomyces sp. NBC_00243]
MGTGASMLWWKEGFCRMLAGSGRCDSGRSVTYEPGRPAYTASDLVGDAAEISEVAAGLAATG